jgi:hypothetical protein
VRCLHCHECWPEHDPATSACILTEEEQSTLPYTFEAEGWTDPLTASRT